VRAHSRYLTLSDMAPHPLEHLAVYVETGEEQNDAWTPVILGTAVIPGTATIICNGLTNAVEIDGVVQDNGEPWGRVFHEQGVVFMATPQFKDRDRRDTIILQWWEP